MHSPLGFLRFSLQNYRIFWLNFGVNLCLFFEDLWFERERRGEWFLFIRLWTFQDSLRNIIELFRPPPSALAPFWNKYSDSSFVSKGSGKGITVICGCNRAIINWFYQHSFRSFLAQKKGQFGPIATLPHATIFYKWTPNWTPRGHLRGRNQKKRNLLLPPLGHKKTDICVPPWKWLTLVEKYTDTQQVPPKKNHDFLRSFVDNQNSRESLNYAHRRICKCGNFLVSRKPLHVFKRDKGENKIHLSSRLSSRLPALYEALVFIFFVPSEIIIRFPLQKKHRTLSACQKCITHASPPPIASRTRATTKGRVYTFLP